jgi:hypothetical protein
VYFLVSSRNIFRIFVFLVYIPKLPLEFNVWPSLFNIKLNCNFINLIKQCSSYKMTHTNYYLQCVLRIRRNIMLAVIFTSFLTTQQVNVKDRYHREHLANIPFNAVYKNGYKFVCANLCFGFGFLNICLILVYPAVESYYIWCTTMVLTAPMENEKSNCEIQVLY